MKNLPTLLTLWLALLCGCQTSKPVMNSSAQAATLSVRIYTTDYAQVTNPRVYVDGSFAGNYSEGMVLHPPAGKHAVAVEIAQVDELRRETRGKTTITTTIGSYKLTGKETIMLFGGESAQDVVFDMTNLKKTKIAINDPH